MASVESISQLLAHSLDYRETKAAGSQLRELESSPHFSLNVLQIAGDTNSPLDVRMAAAALFKNLIKSRWNDADGNYLMHQDDVMAIKSNILDLMISVPAGPRKQLGEAVALIANSDFPDRWPMLVPELISKLNPDTPAVNNAVLEVMHVIFERWRALSRSDALFLEIKLVLDQLTQPYLAYIVESDKKFRETKSREWLTSMDLLMKIYYDLNCQDLPEFFEDHMTEFMGFMFDYLTMSLDGVDKDADEDNAGVGEALKTDICEVLALYTERYEEEFAQYMPKFVEAGWILLTTIGSEPRNDLLVNRCLKFLTAVAKFERNIHMFNSEETLRQIVERIVMPNMRMRETDLEAFEDEPLEYVRHDLEGTDNETRRQAATIFLRELAGKIEGDVTNVVMRYVNQFLALYSLSPAQNWLEKSTAVSLFSAIAAKGQITSAGVSTTNLLIDVVGFFNANMAPELATAGSVHAVLKVDAIRFILSFRNQLTKAQLSQALHMLTMLLNKEQHATVYTYSAITLERILAILDPVSNQSMFGEQDISGHVKDMSTHTLMLVTTVSKKPEELAANEFLMKLLMRILVVSGGQVKHVAQLLVPQLVQIIQAISANPSNPKFTHYCFESLGACLKYYRDFGVLETQVVQPLFAILGSDVTEFVPYVLQILTEILNFQPAEAGVPASFQQLLKPVLSPQLWEARGNVPALVGFLEVIVKRGPSLVLESQLLLPLLGVYQNLLASPSRDQYSFELLECIITSIPIGELVQYLPQVVKLLLMRLQKSKSERFGLHLTRFIFTVAASSQPLGGNFIVEMFDNSGNGSDQLFGELFTSLVAPKTLQIHGSVQRRVAAVGLTNLLCGTTQFVSGKYVSLWSLGVTQLVGLLTNELAEPNDLLLPDLDVAEMSFGSSFSPLATAKIKPVSPIAYLCVTPQQYFAAEMKKVVQNTAIQAQLQQVGNDERQYLTSVLS